MKTRKQLIAYISTLALSVAAFAQTTTITFLGDSLTVGVDYTTNSVGGFRDPLYSRLTSLAIPTLFVGSNCATQESTAQLNNAVPTQNCHDGFGGYHTVDLAANLDGVAAPVGGGDSNLGGYWITGGPNSTGCASIIHDLSGTNDIHQGSQTLYADKLALDQKLHRLCPNSILLVASIPPMAGFAAQPAYDAWIQSTLVPELMDPITGKSYAIFVDEQSPFLSNGQIINIGTDGLHPTLTGYQSMVPNLLAGIQAAMASLLGNPTPATAALTVNCGSGSGMYPIGTVVTITASPTGCVPFNGWTGPVASASSTTTTIVMPATATTVYANYGASVPPTVTQPTAPSGGSSVLTPLGPYQIENETTSIVGSPGAGTTLITQYGSSADGLQVDTYWVNTGETWTAINVNGSYEFADSVGGRCITTGTSGGVTIQDCAALPTQLFVLTLNADNSYLIQQGSMCLIEPTPFSQVQTATCSTAAINQRWNFVQ